MIRKKFLTRLKIFSVSAGLLVLAVVFLMTVPRGINLVESSTTLLGNQIPTNTENNVAGVEKTQVDIQSRGIIPPQVGALAVLAEDFDSNKILYQKEIHKRLLPASTTKMMTALVAVDYFKMADSLEVKPESLVGGSTMGLSLGERLSFRSLLYGMLLNSGNDAAFTIAANYPGGVDNFVVAMNQRAQALGLLDTHFQNPAGFDDQMQYSSASDLAKIAHQAVLNPTLAKVIATKDTEVTAAGGGKDFFLHNLNKLLGEDGVLGIKTGTTEEAGQNFVGLVERNGHKIITVVLDSTDRFNDSKKLIDWVYSNFTWTDQ